MRFHLSGPRAFREYFGVSVNSPDFHGSRQHYIPVEDEDLREPPPDTFLVDDSGNHITPPPWYLSAFMRRRWGHVD
jgi:hypothetical protein